MSKRSQKNQKRKQKEKQSKQLLIGLVSGGIVLIAVALFLAFGGSSKDDGGGTPVVSVDQELIDYGVVKFNTELAFEVTVTNEGDGTLRFKEVPYIEVRDGC